MLPLAALYGLGWHGYRLAFSLGLKKSAKPHRPILCVGNLLVGGSGKTPVVRHIANLLLNLGKDAVLSMNGYGSRHYRQPAVAPEGALSPVEWGDEPAMMRWLEPELPLVIGKDRVAAAHLVADRFPNAVMLLDDGFQHLELEKDATIVIDPPELANRFLTPAGPYREPYKAGVARADLVLGRSFTVKRGFGGLIDPATGNDCTETQVDVLCAIARPHRFLETLESAGIEANTVVLRADHDPLSDPQLVKAFSGERPVAVTAKDWVKLSHHGQVETHEWRVARDQATVEPEAEFTEWLKEAVA